MKTNMLPTLALGLFVLGTAGGATASAMPAAPLPQDDPAGVTQVQYRYDPYYDYDAGPRARVTVHPGRYHYDDYSNYPYSRGFEDHNPVPRGNIRGCSVDLGYGRYESCDK